MSLIFLSKVWESKKLAKNKGTNIAKKISKMWVIFSILAALSWAIGNIIDKYILTKWVRQPIIPAIILGIVGLIASTIIYFVYGFSYLSYFNIFLALISGIFYTLMVIFYFKALKIEEASRVIPLFFLSPFFVLIFARIFLEEVFIPLKYLGIFLLVVGAILISSKNLSQISFGKASFWMLLAAFFLSLNDLLTKYLLNFTDYWTIFAYTRIGMVIGLIPLAYIYFPELINTIERYGKRVIVVISATETLNLLGILFITIAMSIGYVTLVSALSSIQPFFVLLLAIILSRFYPFILKEEIGKAIVFQKLLAIFLMFIGAILIT